MISVIFIIILWCRCYYLLSHFTCEETEVYRVCTLTEVTRLQMTESQVRQALNPCVFKSGKETLQRATWKPMSHERHSQQRTDGHPRSPVTSNPGNLCSQGICHLEGLSDSSYVSSPHRQGLRPGPLPAHRWSLSYKEETIWKIKSFIPLSCSPYYQGQETASPPKLG